MENEKIRINISNTQYEVIQDLARDLGFVVNDEIEDKDSDIFWIDNALTPDQLSALTSYQRINHFPGIYCISRKDHLGKNLKAMRAAFPDAYNFFPPTWVLPKDLSDFKLQFNEKRAKTFICKPENLSQGKGIFLTRKLEEVPERCVVQRYLHKPYLLDGLKFDLRVYVLLISCDPLRVYIHKEGLVRLATEPYITPTPSNLDNICMHLTNYAINKFSSKFVFNQDAEKSFAGHKRSLSAFLSNLKESGENTEKLWIDISDIVMKTLCVAQPLLAHLYRSSQPNDLSNSICFQILGFDIFLDDRLRPYLLEVNHTPSFTTDTPLDLKVKKMVIGDALRMLGINKKMEFDLKIPRSTRGVKVLRNVRNEIKEKWNYSRILVEDQVRGGYSRIFPAVGQEVYEEYMTAARDVWMTNLGIRKKYNREGSAGPVKLSPVVAHKSNLSSLGQRSCNHKVGSPVFLADSRQAYSPNKSQVKKLPAIKLAYGNYLHPRVFDFNDYCHTIINKDIEKQG
jgi:tubulin polyglutamylase TTLL6/13